MLHIHLTCAAYLHTKLKHMNQRIKNKNYTPKEHLKLINKGFEKARSMRLESQYQGFIINGNVKRLVKVLGRNGYKTKISILNKKTISVKVFNRLKMEVV